MKHQQKNMGLLPGEGEADYFQWTEVLDVGVDELNEDHKTIISLMNRLHEQNMTGLERNIQYSTLLDLQYFTALHFKNEERYMASIGYAARHSHAEKHTQLLEKLNEYIREFEESDNPLPDEFFHFLKLWLTAHIQHVDMNYSRRKKM